MKSPWNLADGCVKFPKPPARPGELIAIMTLGFLRFGSFALDLERLTLNGPAGPANLRRKSFDVLRYLAERAGRVVTKEELIKAVWPGVTVGDESLTKCISEVRQAIGDEGQSLIKTVPRRGYLFDVPIAPTGTPAGGAAGAASPVAPDRPSIAVLPFANMSGDPQQEYVSDGIVEDIITELSRFSGLFVIARNSSFQWKGRTVDARQVGRELGVRYLLEGSVRRAGQRLRISTQLINAESGNHLWAERYDRDVQDVFALQDEVARTVAAILAAHMTKAEAERTVLKPPKSWQAYDHYMRAAEVHATFHRAMQVAAMYETRELLDRCLSMEPGFARAHALYSATLVTTWTLALDGDHRNPPVLENALRWAEKAVQLDPNLPEAHAQLGYALGYMGKPDAAVAAFERAIALNPNFTDWRFAAVLDWAGQADRAIEAATAHLRVDPFALPIARAYLGLGYLMRRRYTEAVTTLREFVSQSPNHRPGRCWLAAAYAHLGEIDEARVQAAHVLRIDPDFVTTGYRKLAEFWRPADVEHVIGGLRKAGLMVS
jgi:adenylate cyclase